MRKGPDCDYNKRGQFRYIYCVTVNLVMVAIVQLYVITSTYPLGTLGSLASLLAATIYQGNHDKNYKLWNIRST